MPKSPVKPVPEPVKPRGGSRRARWKHAKFEAAMQLFPRFSQQNRDVVRRVLVEGHSMAVVATEVGVSRQRVSELVGFVKKKATPQGWVTESVTVPAELMTYIRSLEREARAKHEAST